MSRYMSKNMAACCFNDAMLSPRIYEELLLSNMFCIVMFQGSSVQQLCDCVWRFLAEIAFSVLAVQVFLLLWASLTCPSTETWPLWKVDVLSVYFETSWDQYMWWITQLEFTVCPHGDERLSPDHYYTSLQCVRVNWMWFLQLFLHVAPGQTCCGDPVHHHHTFVCWWKLIVCLICDVTWHNAE